MADFKVNFVLFINFLSILQVSLLETVHFTNSRNKILRANNFTTYKVEVPNGEAITIIEANMPLINKNLKFNEVENAKYPIKHEQDNANRNQVMDLKTSLSMTVTPHNNNDEYENLPAGGEESVSNDYGSNLSPELTHHRHHSMKTVYSPELLTKFLKDYANKVQSTEPTVTEESIKPMEHEEIDGMKDKYESIEAEDDDDGNRRVSNADEEGQEPVGPVDVQERKHYRPGGGNYQHPYNKNNGWVTLDAVPWSKSKVSKWQSSVKPYNQNSGYNHQSGSSNHNNRPPRPPSYNYEEDNEDVDYYNQKPSRPTFQNNQFYGAGSSSHSNIRPPQDPYSHHSHSSHHSSSSDNNYDNDYRPNRPYQPEIITDNRPSNFPSQPESSHNQNDYNQNRPNNYDNRPNVYDNRPPSRPNHNDYHYSGNQGYNHYSNKDGPHPLTYPNGDGEWVLVSTTKGYQFPKRNGQRAMMFQAQNGVKGTDTRKNDNKGIITAASHQYETAVTFRPPYQAGPTKTSQQQVKLTVLPLFTKNENRPQQSHHQYHHNNMEVNVYKPSHYNGVIETEPSSQTVEESVASAAHANESNSVTASAQKIPKKKRKHIKNYAVMRKNSGSDSTAVLAAVSVSHCL